MNGNFVGKAVVGLLLAVSLTGCIRMKVTSASTPVVTGPVAATSQQKPGRIALHVMRLSPAAARDDFSTAVQRKYKDQLTAAGYEVIDLSQAGPQDLVLRTDLRYYSVYQDATIMLCAGTLGVLPFISGSEVLLDSTLIRDGEVLGVSRQAMGFKAMAGLLPVALLYGKKGDENLFYPQIQLNTDLLRAQAQGVVAGGR